MTDKKPATPKSRAPSAAGSEDAVGDPSVRPKRTATRESKQKASGPGPKPQQASQAGKAVSPAKRSKAKPVTTAKPATKANKPKEAKAAAESTLKPEGPKKSAKSKSASRKPAATRKAAGKKPAGKPVATRRAAGGKPSGQARRRGAEIDDRVTAEAPGGTVTEDRTMPALDSGESPTSPAATQELPETNYSPGEMPSAWAAQTGLTASGGTGPPGFFNSSGVWNPSSVSEMAHDLIEHQESFGLEKRLLAKWRARKARK